MVASSSCQAWLAHHAACVASMPPLQYRMQRSKDGFPKAVLFCLTQRGTHQISISG
jgi:hypothetical protein